MWSLINVSSNLHTTDVKLTGLQCSGLFLDPFLNSGIMFARDRPVVSGLGIVYTYFHHFPVINRIITCKMGLHGEKNNVVTASLP